MNIQVINTDTFNNHDIEVDVTYSSLTQSFDGDVTIDDVTYSGEHEARDFEEYGFVLSQTSAS